MFLGAWLNLCEPRAVVAEIALHCKLILPLHSVVLSLRGASVARNSLSQLHVHRNGVIWLVLPKGMWVAVIYATSQPRLLRSWWGFPRLSSCFPGGNKELWGPGRWLDHKMEGTWIPNQHAKESHLSPRNTCVGHLSEWETNFYWVMIVKMLGLFVIAAGVVLTNKVIICRMVYWFEVLHKPRLQIFHSLIYSSVHF